jgi:hypothetical protein
VFPGCFLRVDEIPIQLDLEYPSARRDQDDLVQLALELFKYPLRQTDGSRCVASLGAVLDGYLHAPTLVHRLLKDG